MTTFISADNGSISGSAGLKSTPDSSGILALQTGANVTALTIDASQNAVFAATTRTLGYAVAGLPAAGVAGRRAYVTNALAPVFGSAVATGGLVSVPVFDNGTAWIVG